MSAHSPAVWFKFPIPIETVIKLKQNKKTERDIHCRHIIVYGVHTHITHRQSTHKKLSIIIIIHQPKYRMVPGSPHDFNSDLSQTLRIFDSYRTNRDNPFKKTYSLRNSTYGLLENTLYLIDSSTTKGRDIHSSKSHQKESWSFSFDVIFPEMPTTDSNTHDP